MENEEEIPLLEHEEKDDDDDGGDTTHPFQPGGASTPGPSGEEIPLTTMNRGKEKGSGIAETTFIEGSPLSRVLTSNEKAWDSLTGIFPDANATELEAKYSKTGKLQVKMFGQGKRAYPLFTKDKDSGGQRLNPILPRQIKSSLGTERDTLIVQKEKEIEELHKSIREDEEIANNENEQPSVRERTREKIAEKLEQINALENERDELEGGGGGGTQRKSQEYLQKVRIYNSSCMFGSWYSYRSNPRLTDKRTQVCCHRGRKRIKRSWKKDRWNTSWFYRSNRQLYFQNRWIRRELPR